MMPNLKTSKRAQIWPHVTAAIRNYVDRRTAYAPKPLNAPSV